MAGHFLAGVDAEPGKRPRAERWGLRPRLYVRGTLYAAEIQASPGDGAGIVGDHFHVYAEGHGRRKLVGTIRFGLSGEPWLDRAAADVPVEGGAE